MIPAFCTSPHKGEMQRGGIGPLGGLSMKTDSTLSRRRLLAGVPAVAAVGVPSVATALSGLAAEPDPIFAAIEEHKRMNVLFAASFEGSEEETNEAGDDETAAF
jgi:hypothetical protein